MIKKIFLFILVLTAVGCATAPKLTVVNPTGEPIPEPHYVLRDTNGTVQVTFYYQAVGWIEDLDKTRQPNPVFLDRNIKHVFSPKKYDRLMLVMKVFNPRNIKYKIITRQAVVFKGNGQLRNLTTVAASHLQFRNHEFFLPFSEGTKTVKVSFEIQSSDGRTLIRTGNFHYSLY